ncbi:MAG: hypothetical protein OK454_06085 [Thaumarchaeota archaeon]|nr:hypothetical protein [Nitrososphaerota archaeon]
MQQSCTSGTPSATLGIQPTEGFAFDADGNLWCAVRGQGVVGYSSGDLTQDGFPPEFWLLGGPDMFIDEGSPSDLAFDSQGFLWVAHGSDLLAFSPSSRLASLDGGVDGGTSLAGLIITSPCMVPDAGPSTCHASAFTFLKIAFDGAGNLWATVLISGDELEYGVVVYSRSQLETAAIDEPSPTLVLSIKGYQVWSLAFDQDGNLWTGAYPIPFPFGDDAGPPHLYRFSRTDLEIIDGGLRKPDVILTLPVEPSESLAFSPIPSNLPIQP